MAKATPSLPQERQSIVDQLARFTGLDRSVIEENDLRIRQSIFCRELLRHQRLIVGRLDSRFTGPLSPGPEGAIYDPTMAVIRPPFTATFNNYVRSDLGYKTDLEYYVLSWVDSGIGVRRAKDFPTPASPCGRRSSKIPT